MRFIQCNIDKVRSGIFLKVSRSQKVVESLFYYYTVKTPIFCTLPFAQKWVLFVNSWYVNVRKGTEIQE